MLRVSLSKSQVIPEDVEAEGGLASIYKFWVATIQFAAGTHQISRQMSHVYIGSVNLKIKG